VTDPGVLPTPEQAKREALNIIQTPFQHTWMSDRGPEIAKERIKTTLGRFLEGSSVTELAAVENDSQRFANAGEALP
jgi:hypothetical protein